MLIKKMQTDVAGYFDLLLDEGYYVLEASKGDEYEVKEVPIEVKKEKMFTSNAITVTHLMEWGAKDYYCGDLHQHSQFR